MSGEGFNLCIAETSAIDSSAVAEILAALDDDAIIAIVAAGIDTVGSVAPAKGEGANSIDAATVGTDAAAIDGNIIRGINVMAVGRDGGDNATVEGQGTIIYIYGRATSACREASRTEALSVDTEAAGSKDGISAFHGERGAVHQNQMDGAIGPDSFLVSISDIHIAADGIPCLRSCGAKYDGAARATLDEGIVGADLLVAVGVDIRHSYGGGHGNVAIGHGEGVAGKRSAIHAVAGNDAALWRGVAQRDVLCGTAIDGSGVACGVAEDRGANGGEAAHVVCRLVACNADILTQGDGACATGTVAVATVHAANAVGGIVVVG